MRFGGVWLQMLMWAGGFLVRCVWMEDVSHQMGGRPPYGFLPVVRRRAECLRDASLTWFFFRINISIPLS